MLREHCPGTQWRASQKVYVFSYLNCSLVALLGPVRYNNSYCSSRFHKKVRCTFVTFARYFESGSNRDCTRRFTSFSEMLTQQRQLQTSHRPQTLVVNVQHHRPVGICPNIYSIPKKLFAQKEGRSSDYYLNKRKNFTIYSQIVRESNCKQLLYKSRTF